MATYDTSEWSIYGERDLSIMDFWRDKYDKANAWVSWSYRDDKKCCKKFSISTLSQANKYTFFSFIFVLNIYKIVYEIGEDKKFRHEKIFSVWKMEMKILTIGTQQLVMTNICCNQ